MWEVKKKDVISRVSWVENEIIEEVRITSELGFSRACIIAYNFATMRA